MDAVILPFIRKRRHGSPAANPGVRWDHGAREDARPSPVLPVEYGSGWYHDAAIKEHERPLRHED